MTLTKNIIEQTYQTIREIASASQVEVKINSASVTGIKTRVEVQQEISALGEIQRYSGAVRILVSELEAQNETLPRAGDVVKIDDVEYTVMKVEQDAGGVTATIFYGEKYG
jgi:hypothetical protein